MILHGDCKPGAGGASVSEKRAYNNKSASFPGAFVVG
jgi:hypothetical protein